MAGQLHGNAADSYASCARIKNERSAPKLGMSEAAGAADQGSNPCEDFFHPERLRDVVVRPAVNPLDFLVPASTRGQNEHGREYTRFPPAAQQSEPVYLWKSQVEHHHVILLGVCKKIGLFPIGSAVDGVSGLGEPFRQLLGQERFVLYHQNPQ
jgi:hypothetical protein